MRYGSRVQLILALLVMAFLFASLFASALVAASPITRNARGPIILTILIITLVTSVLCLVLLFRWLLRPYRQLVGEAERAPISARSGKARDEAQFVLETFQSVVAQLQAQQRELERLSAQASARADSAQKFSDRIVASVPSGLIAFDARGRATLVNAPARALIEVNGQAEGQFVLSLLRHAPELAEMIQRCLNHGEVYRREEVPVASADGGVKRLGATVAPIDLAHERGALCLLTDLTEVTQLREQVAFKKNLESLGEMSAGLAHEFKNALATLHGSAQLIQKLELDEPGRAAADSLLEEVRSLSAMVTAFLNFARPQPLHLEKVSLEELIQECSEELRALYEKRQIALVIEGQYPEIRAGDKRMLRQALLNLLRNAAEAIDENEAERRVTVHGARARDANGDEWATIEISDTGRGIPLVDLQRIFIPFFTTKSNGHGVGLALAHRVITDHGGALTAANARAGGAIFTIKLPIAGHTETRVINQPQRHRDTETEQDRDGNRRPSVKSRFS